MLAHLVYSSPHCLRREVLIGQLRIDMVREVKHLFQKIETEMNVRFEDIFPRWLSFFAVWYWSRLCKSHALKSLDEIHDPETE